LGACVHPAVTNADYLCPGDTAAQVNAIIMIKNRIAGGVVVAIPFVYGLVKVLHGMGKQQIIFQRKGKFGGINNRVRNIPSRKLNPLRKRGKPAGSGVRHNPQAVVFGGHGVGNAGQHQRVVID
jgi:hypothetical protein